ncbi:unnamed protein product [Aphanomyces euteiches]|uniref:Peptidase M13 N-terminal domain-containing protein n=1 Tax=Aphanomyces euteiches TaxID=100861 RepID=A0A6G0WT08_9STRA|nr:hypothetical protein Ae201684_011998 [Aphanomyces euteiches]KAH9056209.1 hypothetical protein Ae201684P_021946 [Aphanomyces euteiches]
MTSEYTSLLHNTQQAQAAERPWWFKYAAAGGVVAVVGGVVWATTGGSHGTTEVINQGLGGPATTVIPTTTAATTSLPTTTVAPATTTATPVATEVPTTTVATSTPVPNVTSDTIVFPGTPEPTHPAEFAAFFQDLADKMDLSVDPCDNFYQYACGNWLNKTELNASVSRIDSSFYVIGKDNDKILKSILAGKPAIIDPFYQACVSETSVNGDAVVDLSVKLLNIANIATVNDLIAFAGKLSVVSSTESFFSVGVTVDAKNSTVHVLELAQGGLTLPSIEYYAAEQLPTYVAALDKYLKSLSAVEAFHAVPASTILDFEAKLAKISLTQAQLRDPWGTYHKFSLAEVLAKYPLIASYLSGAQPELLNETNSIQVEVPTPTFFEALPALLASTDLAVLKAYLSFRLIYARSTLLGEAFREPTHEFNSALNGQSSVTKQTREEFCLALTENILGEYLGKLFMDKVFDSHTKTQAQALIKQIEDAMVDVVNQDTWLDTPTRRVALEKVAKIRNFIGGPNDVSPLPFNISSSFYANMNHFNEWSTNSTWASLHEPVDQTAWDMFAYTVNAYNQPSANKIVFPAAILQPPFYNAKAFPAVVNYARIGMVMGHELTHGFDDEGRNYDPQGQLNSWWTDNVAATFDKNAKCLADQYSTFPVISAVDKKTVLGHVNGKLTLGENIADNGGLKLAYIAYQQAKKANASIADIGYDDAKLYFTAYAQTWCEKRVDGNALLQINTDPHSPGKWRVHGPLLNSQSFADAFQCPAGSPMNPVKKCVVW